MVRTGALALAVLALAPAAAHATELIGTGPATAALYTQWIAESQLPAPDVSLVIQNRPCSEEGSNACLKRTRRPMHLVMSDQTWLFGTDTGLAGAELVRYQLAYRLEFLHELGHAADLRPNRPADAKQRYRTVFSRILNYQPCKSDCGAYGWWWAYDERGRYVDPFEQFAMGYAYCAHDRYWLDPAVFLAYPGYGYRPTQRQHKRVCRLIGRWL